MMMNFWYYVLLLSLTNQSLLQDFVSHVADVKLAQQQAKLPTGCDTIDKVLQGESKHT